MSHQPRSSAQLLAAEMAQAENERINRVLSQLHSDYLIHIKQPSLLNLHTNLIVTTPRNLASRITTHELKIRGSYADLPFPSNSCGILLLSHVLEFEKHPQQLLTEAWRVLNDAGHLILVGCNPWSLYGIRHWLHLDREKPLRHTYLHSTKNLQRWVHHLGGEIKIIEKFFFRPPVNQLYLLKKLSWMEKIPPSFVPYSGSFYLILAQKLTIPATPIKTRYPWQAILNKNNKTLVPATKGLFNKSS